MADSYNVTNKRFLPVLPLKNVVALPKSIIPVVVGREFSMKAVEFALRETREVLVVAQKSADVEVPNQEDIYHYGTRATILQVGRMQNNTFKLLIEGSSRSRIVDFISNDGFMCVECEDLEPKQIRKKVDEKALARSLYAQFEEYVTLHEQLSTDVMSALNGLEEDLDYFMDTIAIQMRLELKDRQILLETIGLRQRAIKLAALLKDETEILKAEKTIRKRVQSQVEKHQKDYYLTEQMRAIQRELGREDHAQEVSELREKAKKCNMNKEAFEKVESECRRLEQMQPTSPEAAVSRNYVEWLISLPWKEYSRDSVSLEKAEKLLDASHARMQKAKDRIIEFLAAKKFAKDKLEKAPIICLAGPPGVGKTSLASSVAKALGRKMVRISLGGVRDEAEIRGHRRTYIGAMPGKILQAMKKAKVMNPVILLDEIDKMAMDFRGDPSSALLEVLDPEQNKSFVDHFVEVEYDLSKVMFITTANVIDNIPYPLYDRMEIIQLSGYTLHEKMIIARKFLLPRLAKEHALKTSQVVIDDDVLNIVIEGYTKEAGVRQLTRVIAKIMRKSIQVLLKNPKRKRITVTTESLEEWLGAEKFRPNERYTEDSIGYVNGLAWTELGGETLEIEVSMLKGKGGFTLTGQLGEVMQESAQAAFTCVRARAKDLKIKQAAFSSNDLHVHLPEGGIPKDGPSAGIALATAFASVLTGRPVRADVAMTGEVTLRGRVLAIGGVKEKLLAASRFGIKKVLLPEKNKRDVKEFIADIDVDMKIVYVSTIDEVFSHALADAPAKKNYMKKSISKKSS